MMQQHIVFFNIAATGHVNPTLPLVKQLCLQGAQVTYFVPSESLRGVIESAGAAWRPTQDLLEMPSQELREEIGLAPDAPPESYKFPNYVLALAAKSLPSLIAELEALEPRPSVIVYDPFMPNALVASRLLGIPAVGMVTVPGPGVMAKPAHVTEFDEANSLTQMGRRQIQEMYDFDVFEQGMLNEFYSPDHNIVTTCDELFAKPSSELQIQRFENITAWKCVGPLMDRSVKRIAHAKAARDAEALPWDFIDAEVRSGKRLLCLSLGTVANSFFYSIAIGSQALENGLSQVTGKAFLQHVFSTAFEALRNEKDVLVLMAVGPNADVLEGLPAAPENFILRETLPQLDVLSKCHGFISHGGANSMHEALGFGVPMVVVPVFGDQPINADSVTHVGAGFSFKRPLETLTVEALNEAVMAILNPGAGNTHRAGAEVMMHQMKQAGGVQAAADYIAQVGTESAVQLAGA